MERVGEPFAEQAEARRLGPPVDDLERRPAGPGGDRREGDGVAGGDERVDGRRRGDEGGGGVGPAGPLEEQVAGVPGRDAFVGEAFVGVVEHDDGAQVRDRGERGDAAAEHDAGAPAGGLPRRGADGGGVGAVRLDDDPAGGAGGCGEGGALGGVGGDDDRGALGGEQRQDEVGAGPGRWPHDEASGLVG